MRTHAAVLAALCLSATAAGAFEVPGCEALAAWGATAGTEVALNADTALPPAYAPDATEAVFGLAFLAWAKPELDAIDAALARCRSEASSARDRAAADGFNAQRRTLGQMGRVLRDVAAARDNVARAREGIAAGPQTPQLRADLQALADTEAADLGGFRTQLRDVSLLARALALLPSAEQASVLGEAAAMAEGLGAAMIDARLAAIGEAPATGEGILAVRAAALAARGELGDGAAPVLAAAAAREAEIAAAIAATPDAPIALPGCAALLDWGAAVDLRGSRNTSAGRVLTALEEPSLAGLVGRGFPDWTEGDLALFAALGQHCIEAARAGALGEDQRERERAARAMADFARSLDRQRPVFAAMAEGRARVAGLMAEIEAVGADEAGLAALQALGSRIGRDLDRADADALRAALAARREAVGAAIVAGHAGALEEAPATLAGIEAIREAFFAVATSPLWWQLSDAERGRLVAAAEAAQAARAAAALPEFEAALAALPASFDGLGELAALAERSIPAEGAEWAAWRAAVDARRDAIVPVAVEAGLPELEAIWDSVPQTADGYAGLLAQTFEIARMAVDQHPAFGQVAARSAAKAAAMRAALLEARCAPAVAEAGLGGGDGPLVLAGGATVPLDAFLCDLAGKSGGPVGYDGPGFFGSEHRITLMLPEGWQGGFVLREAEVRPGVKALVGIRAEEPTGTRELSTAEWSEAASWISGVDACGFQAGVAQGTPGGSPDWQRLAECLIAHPSAPDPVPGAG